MPERLEAYIKTSDAGKIRELKKTNRAEEMFAEMSIESRALKGCLKKSYNAQSERKTVEHLVKEEQLSNRKACKLIGFPNHLSV